MAPISKRRRRASPEHPTRRLLIETTARVLAARGAHDTLLEDVVDAAGVTKGALYHHFADFAELIEVTLVELFDRDIDAELGDLRQATSSAANSGEFYAALAQTPIRRLEGVGGHLGWLEVLTLTGAYPALRTRLRDGQRRLFDGYVEVLENGLARGWVRTDVATGTVATVAVALRLAPLWSGPESDDAENGRELSLAATLGVLVRYLQP